MDLGLIPVRRYDLRAGVIVQGKLLYIMNKDLVQLPELQKNQTKFIHGGREKVQYVEEVHNEILFITLWTMNKVP